jgi:acyl-CoA thioester hydrolase
MKPSHSNLLRVRYSEVDGLGTYYNSRALEWFECGRTELCRALGKPYSEWEREGVGLPLITAHVQYQGKARYDDLLRVTTTASQVGRARLRFDMQIVLAESGEPVCHGYTIHAVTDLTGRPIRPPQWLLAMLESPDCPPGGDSLE